MASYEKAEALQTYVKKNLKKINDLIQDLPDISEFEDVIDDISNVNSKIPNYKHIKNFAVRDKEFEKTTTQKIKRYGDNMKK